MIRSRQHPEPAWLRGIDRSSQVLAGISGLALLTMAVIVVLDVSGRTMLNIPVTGTLEYVTFWMMPMLVFLALGAAQLRGEHLRVTLNTDDLAPKARRITDAAAFTFCAVILMVLIYYAGLGAAEATQVKQAALGLAVVPIWPVKWFMALGLTLLLAQCIATVYRIVFLPPPNREQTLEELAGSAI
jgi:TRAP-type C4-dicarboxylate transport system permease small subunit